MTRPPSSAPLWPPRNDLAAVLGAALAAAQ